MKIKTIEHLLQLAKDTNNIHTQNILDILKIEKQRKEQKKPKIIHLPSTGCRLTIESIERLLKEKDEKINELKGKYDEGYKAGFEWCENQLPEVKQWNEIKNEPIAQFLFNNIDKGYHITSTGKVIINDGDKFDELFAKLAQAYLNKINIPSLIIVSDKCK